MKPFDVLVVVRHPVGGIRTFLRYVYRNLHTERYRFTLVAPDIPQTAVLLDDLKELGVRYIGVGTEGGTRDFFKAVNRIAFSERFDLVHSHGFIAAGSALPGALIRRTPHLVTCHDVFANGQLSGIGGAAKRGALGTILSMADRVHCVSHDARANLLEHIVVLRPVARKVLAIPNGIEVERFQRDEQRDLRRELGLPADSFLIGFLGRFMSQKGFRYLVSAFERVRAANCSGRTPLVLTFGEQDGFIREEMEDVRRRGLAQSILFQPFVDDVSSTLKGLDVLAMPSLWEACGLLAMEAMVAGVPVIGSDCVGLREVLRDTPATIVPPRDSIALAEALLNEMTRPSTQRARRFARAAAIRFDVRARAADLENVFMQLLVGK